MKAQSITKKKCHETALNYLEHRDRSAYEVVSYLISKGFLQDEIDEELEYLKDLNYVDNMRYCEDYFQYAMRKGRGPVRIRLELKEKGIEEDLIQHTLEVYFDNETEKKAALNEAVKLLERTNVSDCGAGEEKIIDEKTLAKIGRRLASLGYHGDVIYDIIGQMRKSEQ